MIDHHIASVTLTGLRPETLRARRKVLTYFHQSLNGRSLTHATRADVEMYLSRPLAPESRRSYLSHLRAYYRWAIDLELVALDPTAKIPGVRVPRALPRPVSQPDLALALRHAAPRMRAWLLLMSLAGLRCCEVAALEPPDLLDIEGVALLFLRETKGGGQATVPAHPAVVEALVQLPIEDGIWWDLQPGRISAVVAAYLRSLGINATSHRLRHSAGTAWFKASGHDLLTTATLLRHANLNNSRIYAALDPTRPAEVVNLVPLPSAS